MLLMRLMRIMLMHFLTLWKILQIFITDSNKVRMSGIVDGLTADRAYFEAVGGEFREI